MSAPYIHITQYTNQELFDLLTHYCEMVSIFRAVGVDTKHYETEAANVRAELERRGVTV